MIDVTSGLQPVIQLLSPEYQGYVTTAIAVAMGAIALYFTVIKPLLTIGANAKALLASKMENTELKDAAIMSREEMEEMINGTFSKADTLMIESKIVELKVKLPFADEQGKILLEAEILKLEASLV